MVEEAPGLHPDGLLEAAELLVEEGMGTSGSSDLSDPGGPPRGLVIFVFAVRAALLDQRNRCSRSHNVAFSTTRTSVLGRCEVPPLRTLWGIHDSRVCSSMGLFPRTSDPGVRVHGGPLPRGC